MKTAGLIAILAFTPAAWGAACFDPGSYRSPNPAVEQNFQRGLQYFSQRQYTAARHYLEAAAQAGHPRAEELMGQIYQFGFGVRPDPQISIRYFTAAAEQGHRGAINDMGFYYSQVVVDLPKANQYFLVAARCGNFDSQVELGLNYEFGRGVPRDRQQAVYWISQAAPHWGQAHFVLDILRRPDTPRFQNAEQLGIYIGNKINMQILLTLPSGAPIPGHPSCYASVDANCRNDPSSAAYKVFHPEKQH